MRKDQTDMIWNMTVLLLGALVLLAGGRLLFLPLASKATVHGSLSFFC